MAKTFTIGKQSIEVSDELEAYNELHYEYLLAAKESARKFEEMYLSQNKTKEDVLNNTPDQISEGLENTLFVSLRHFLHEGIFEIDKYIFEEYCKENGYLSVYNCYEELRTMCDQVEAQKNQVMEERAASVENGPMVFGGGFGIKGAMGAVLATQGTEFGLKMVRKGMNSIANWKTKRYAEKEKNALVMDEKTANKLVDCMYESAFNTHYAYIDIMEERQNIKIPKYEQSDKRTALAMHHNIKMLVPERELQEKISAQMLSLNPYEAEFYSNLIFHYGDCNGEFQKIANFFHVDIDEIKQDLQQKYASSFEYQNIDTIKNVIPKLCDRAKFFGLKDTIRDEINEKTRIAYYQWVFSKFYDKTLDIYMLHMENKQKLLDNISMYVENMQKQIDTLYETCFDGVSREAFVSGKDLHEGVYFTVLNSTEKDATAFCLMWNGLSYGRDMWIDYGDICEIHCESDVLIINNTIRIPLLQDLDSASLESFLNETIKMLQQQNHIKIQEILTLGEIENDKTKKYREILKQIFSADGAQLNCIRRNVTIFDATNLSHLITLNNIKVKLNTFWENHEDIYPIYWLDSDKENVIFTDKGIGFTDTGSFITYESLEKECTIQEGKIYIDHENVEYLLFSAECDELEELKCFINYTISILKGEDVAIVHHNHTTYESSKQMEVFARWMEEFLLKRAGNESRNLISEFLLLNYNDQEFYSFVNTIRDRFSIGDTEKLLFMIRPYYYEADMVLVSERWIYVMKNDKDNMVNPIQIPVKNYQNIYVNHSSEEKELYLEYMDSKGEIQQLLIGDIKDNENIVKRHVLLEYILKKIFAYVKDISLQTIPEDVQINSKIYLEHVYTAYTETLPKLRKRLIYFDLTEAMYNKTKWIENAKWSFLSNSPYEKIVLFYNSAKLNPGNAGIVLTDKYLYIKGKMIFKIRVSDIREFRVSVKNGSGSICIVTESQTYESRLDGYPQLVELGDMLSDLIFYIQGHASSVVDAFHVAEMYGERQKARRSMAAVFKEKQKEALQRIEGFILDNADVSLFNGDDQPQIILNDESDTFKELFAEAVAQSVIKPDAVELPLFVIQYVDNKNKKFGKKQTPIFATNEFWYNLSSNGILSSAEKLPLKDATKIKIIEGNAVKPSKMLLCFEGVQSGNYQLPEVKRDDFRLYEEFYNVLIGELENLSGEEHYSLDEERAIRSEARNLITNIENMSETDVDEVREKLLQYTLEMVSDVEEVLENHMHTLVMNHMKQYSEDAMTFEEIQIKRNEILRLQYPSRYKEDILQKIDEKLQVLEQKNVSAYVEQAQQFINENRVVSPVFGVVGDNRRTLITQAIMTVQNEKYAFWEAPLISSIRESNLKGVSGYMVMKDKFVIFDNGNIQSYQFAEIDEFVVIEKITSVYLGMIVEGKEIIISNENRKDAELCAVVLTQLIHFISKNIVEQAFRVSIRFITLKGKAKALKDNVSGKLTSATGDAKGKISGVADGALSKLGGFGGKKMSHENEEAANETNSVSNSSTNNVERTEGETKKPDASGIGSMLGGLTDKAKNMGSAIKKPVDESNKKICPECGNEVKINGKFCGKCGHRFEG